MHSEIRHLVFLISTCMMVAIPRARADFSVCSIINDEHLVDCSDLRLKSIPSVFPNHTRQLNLKGNQIQEIPNDAFVGLHKLMSIDLSENNISLIRRYAFRNVSNLIDLKLNGNKLDVHSFESGCFAPLSNLQVFSIYDNLFMRSQSYPEREIQSLMNLRDLDIDIFEGFKFGNGFGYLKRLQKLTVRGYRWFNVYNDSFNAFRNSNISSFIFDLRWGRIPQFEYNILQAFPGLKSIKISSIFESIKSIFNLFYPLQHTHMDNVDLSRIEHVSGISSPVSMEDMKYLTSICLTNLVFRDNGISVIPWFLLSKSPLGKCIQSLDVSQNPLKGVQNIITYIVSFFKSLKYLKMCCLQPCSVLSSQRTERPIKRMQEFFLPPKLELVDLSDNEIFPRVNEDLYFHAKGLKTLNLRRTCTNICAIALFGFNALENLYITDSNCSLVEPRFLRNMSNIKNLEIQNSFLEKGLSRDVEGNFMKGLFKLESIDFSRNKIEFFNTNLLRDQAESLKYLNIRGNMFTDLPNVYFKNIGVIDIRENRLTYLNAKSRSLVEKLNLDLKIYLQGNPLVCSCQTVPFLQWLVDHRFRIADFDDLICINSRNNVTDVVQNLGELKRKCSLKQLITVSASVASSVFVIICIVIVIFLNRIKIEYWRWRLVRYLRLRLYKSGTYAQISHHNYDVFVCYSSSDSSWVRQNIVDMLESEYNLSVCVYEKDFIPGHSIMDCIIEAVEQSEKVAFVISHAFLESDWGAFEMEIARLHAIQTKKPGYLIVILKEDIPESKMPSQLRRIWYRINCITWPDTENERRKNKVKQKLHKAIRRNVEISSL